MRILRYSDLFRTGLPLLIMQPGKFSGKKGFDRRGRKRTHTEEVLLLHLLNFGRKKFEQFGRCQAAKKGSPLLRPTSISTKLMTKMHSLSISALALLASCSIFVGRLSGPAVIISVHGPAIVFVRSSSPRCMCPLSRSRQVHTARLADDR